MFPNVYNPDSPRALFSKNAELREQASMKLMTALDAPRVERVKRAFEERNDSVCLNDFLFIMQENLPSQLYADSGKKELFTNLVDMFKEVDINGDGSMEWEEFTRFMVEKAALYKESQNVERIPNYFHNKQLESCGFRHRGSIDCLTVLPRYKQFACAENGSPIISLYSAKAGNLVTTMQCKAVPLSMCYVEPLQALIASCSDTTMVRFNVGESHHKVRYKQRSVWSTPDTQMTMCWQPTHNLLYSGSVGGRVHSWNVETQEQKSCLEGHTDIVMQVLSIDSLDSIVSGSLDRTINIWDSYTEQQTTKLLGHTKGVNSLAFNSTHRFLISSGFDHDCFVWSPFGSTLLHKLRGHRAALVGCHTVEGTSELLTADTSGIFKLWDLRNFQCLQTFTSDHEPGDLDDLSGTLSCFSHAKFHNPVASLGITGEKIDDYRIIAASKKIVFFDQERVRQDPVTDGPIRVACFNKQSLTIFTASERNVKIWDAVLGSIKSSFKNITSSDITAACLDDRERKFILGQASGTVTVYNYQNGTIMKQFTPQGETPVVKLIYCQKTKAVITCYIDGLIRVYDENDIESCTIVRTFDEAYMHLGDVTSLAYLSSASLVASGGNLPSDGIRLWDFDSGKCETIIKTDGYEILSLLFLDEYPLLIASTSDSMIRIFGIPPFIPTNEIKGGLNNHHLFVEFVNELPDDCLICNETNEALYPYIFKSNEVVTNDEDDMLKSKSNDKGKGKKGDGETTNEVAEEDDDDELLQMNWSPSEIERYKDAKLFLKREMDMKENNGKGKKKKKGKKNNNDNDDDGGDDDEDENITRKNEKKFTKTKKSKSPVSCMSYDKEESCLYTGDEAGHLRKWNLSHVLKHLNLIKLPTNSNHRIGHGNHHSQHQKTKQALHIESLSTLKGRQYSSSLVEFRWGQEVAHEADITTVSITYEPKTILTTSTDCCVKMFSYGGKSLGRLVQSVKTGLQSSCWDIPLNVEKRIENENLEIQSIMDEADKIEALEAEQKAYDENNRYHRHHKGGGGGGGNSIGDGSSIHRNNRRTRKTGSRGTQNSEAIEKEKMHKKVLSVLANVKTSTSQCN